MYGILVSYNDYLDTKIGNTIEDFEKKCGDIQGIFTGRDGDFVIMGRVLETVNNESKEPLIVPELESAEESLIRVVIQEKFGVIGDFHYYFVIK